MKISVFGSSKSYGNHSYEANLYEIGGQLAAQDLNIICGNNGGMLGHFLKGICDQSSKRCQITLCSSDSKKYLSEDYYDHFLQFEGYFQRLEVLCDADLFLVFDGGLGTVAELTVAWNLIQANRSHKKMIVFGDKMKDLSQRILDQFIDQIRYPDIVRLAHSPTEVIQQLQSAIQTTKA